jgi:eukaryotic-like serine/threonine-protein kinase
VFKPVDSDQAKGTVVSTNPPANTQVPQNSQVTVSVSKGPQKVPDVVGLQQSEAENKLRDAGYVPVPVPSASDKPEGEVIQQIPGAGSPQNQGTSVTIVISSGPSSPPSSPTSPTTGSSSPSTSPSTTPPSAKPGG